MMKTRTVMKRTVKRILGKKTKSSCDQLIIVQIVATRLIRTVDTSITLRR